MVYYQMTLIFYLIINHIWIFLDISENVRVMLFKREYFGRYVFGHRPLLRSQLVTFFTTYLVPK